MNRVGKRFRGHYLPPLNAQLSHWILIMNPYKEFDTSKLHDNELKRYFASIMKTMKEVAFSIERGYGLPPHIKEIRPLFIEEKGFNAEADIIDGIAYIAISASVPLLLRVLFDILLSDSEVFPQLPQEESNIKVRYEAPFIFNPRPPFERKQFNIGLTIERADAARILSDKCVKFIFLHEFGHMLCGHIETNRELNPDQPLFEFYGDTTESETYEGLRRYWEYQADCISADLLAQYIDTTVNHAHGAQKWISKLIPEHEHDTNGIVKHVTGMTIAALNVLFMYMDNCRFDANTRAYHPPVITRMMYIKDSLFTSVGERHNLSPHALSEDYYDLYVEPFIFAMDKSGFNAAELWNELHWDNADTVLDELTNDREKHRLRCRQWSWLNVDEWGA